jgi:hypothetical protein
LESSLVDQIKNGITHESLEFVSHPCHLHMLEIIDAIKKNLIKQGLSLEEAQKYIDQYPIRNWVDSTFQENVKQGLLNYIEDVKSYGYLALLEQEVYAYFRFDSDEKKAMTEYEKWLQRYDKGNGFPIK